jgi:hypothetical protein
MAKRIYRGIISSSKTHGSSHQKKNGASLEAPVNSANLTRQEVQEVSRFDFEVRDEGSIWLFTPVSPSAFDFLSEHIQPGAQYFGDSLAVEHRFVYDLLIGLREHGLRAVRG